MSLLTPEIAKRRTCSSATVDFEAFKVSTNFGSDFYERNPVTDDKIEAAKSMFLDIVSEMENEDRQLLLKFMTGRTRLQPGVSQTINFVARKEGLPQGHVCGNSMDVPVYGDKETMRKNLLIAVRLCGEVDNDGMRLGAGLDAANTQLNNFAQGSV